MCADVALLADKQAETELELCLQLEFKHQAGLPDEFSLHHVLHM